MLRFDEVVIGTGGKTACTRCGPPSVPTMRAAEEIAADVDRITSQWPDEPGPNVIFTSAEPFMHPELPAIITAASQAGCERIALSTDAGALSVPQNASGALSAGVTHLEVMMLGGREVHDSCTARPGLYDAATSGVRTFRDAAEKVGASVFVWGTVPVCAHTVASAPDAVVALVSMGASAVSLDVSGLARLDRVHEDLLRAAVETATVNGVAACVLGIDALLDMPFDRMPVSVEGEAR